MFSDRLLNLDALIINWQLKQVDILELIEISDIAICVIWMFWETNIIFSSNVLNQIL